MYFSLLLFGSLAGCTFLVYLWMKRKYKYWLNLGVTSLNPILFYGNYQNFILARCNETDVIDRAYNDLKDARYGGIYFFWKPLLLVKDPEMISRILVKDFASFPNHPLISDMSGSDVVLKSIFFAEGNQWKANRNSLNNLLTPRKLKDMKPSLHQVCDKYMAQLGVFADRGQSVNLQKFMTCLFAEITVSIFLGIQSNEVSEFIRDAAKIISSDTSTLLRIVLYRILPGVHRAFVKTTLSKNVWTFFSGFVKEVLRSDIKDSIDGPGLLTFLLKCKKGEIKGHEGITLEEMVAHIFSFIFGATGTSANTTSLALFELSRNPYIQSRLRAEIEETLKLNDAKWPYDDTLKSNTLMNNVLKETMRMYPAFGVIKRVSKESYKVDEILTIPKDMEVLIPCRAIQNDSRYFEKPDEFNPDRFMTSTNPMFMPFGIGPRQCIGMRSAVMAMKIILSEILDNFEIYPSINIEKPIQFKAKCLLITNRPEQELLVKLRKIAKAT